jgi:predicted nuclease of predicted toxin-antitoxin system
LKLFLDNNLPPSLAKALDALIEPYNHQAIHLSEKFPRNTSDLEWIATLNREGGWVVLSHDQFKEGSICVSGSCSPHHCKHQALR